MSVAAVGFELGPDDVRGCLYVDEGPYAGAWREGPSVVLDDERLDVLTCVESGREVIVTAEEAPWLSVDVAAIRCVLCGALWADPRTEACWRCR